MSEPNVLSMPRDLLRTRCGKWMIRRTPTSVSPVPGCTSSSRLLQVTNGGPLRLCHYPPVSPAPQHCRLISSLVSCSRNSSASGHNSQALSGSSACMSSSEQVFSPNGNFSSGVSQLHVITVLTAREDLHFSSNIIYSCWDCISIFDWIPFSFGSDWDFCFLVDACYLCL